jgi:rhodanese-related sulfurtransferase
MMGWTADDEVLGTARFGPDTAARDYRLETELNVATMTYDFPELSTGGADDFEIVRLAAENWLTTAAAPIIPADKLFENLNDGDAENDPFILSVRNPKHYALGHVPGAAVIPWREVAKPYNLVKLPTDQNITAYCYTGHTGQVATTILGVLGYDVSNMKYGMMGWTADATVLATTPFGPDLQRDYSLEASEVEAEEATPEPTEEPQPEPTAVPTEEPTEEPTAVPEPTEEPVDEVEEEPAEEESGGASWVIWVVVIVVLAGVAWFVLRSRQK